MIHAATAPNPNWVRLLNRPLAVPQFALVATTAVLLGTLYCQLHCIIAFQSMHGMTMPVPGSIAWAVGAVMPWMAGLELAKRRSSWAQSPRARGATIVVLFLVAAALSIVLELGLDQLIGVHETRPLPMQIAAQLPAAAITAALLFVGPRLMPATTATSVAGARASLAEVLSMSPTILWIEAAGNYVEVHTREGLTLHRATMRELEASLDRGQFRRIHRSAIVNLGAVQARVLSRGSEALRLVDGTVLKVGSRYGADFV